LESSDERFVIGEMKRHLYIRIDDPPFQRGFFIPWREIGRWELLPRDDLQIFLNQTIQK
jgi:hypothetical protein